MSLPVGWPAPPSQRILPAHFSPQARNTAWPDDLSSGSQLPQSAASRPSSPRSRRSEVKVARGDGLSRTHRSRNKSAALCLTNVYLPALFISFIQKKTTEAFMLVLSRKQNERIRVGDSVVVTIVRVSGDKVRIGIEAPPDVRVLRDELDEGVVGDVTLDAAAELPIPRLLRCVG
jgi:carbon storage regulator